MPDAELAADFYALTQEITEAHGLPAYEISNHAAPGAESAAQPHLLALSRLCRRRPRRAWPAHGRRREARDGERKASGALAGKGRGRAATALVTDEALTLEEAADEMLLMGLRLREGIRAERYRQMSGRELLARARSISCASTDSSKRAADGRLRTTRDGWLVLDSVVADLAA